MRNTRRTRRTPAKTSASPLKTFFEALEEVYENEIENEIENEMENETPSDYPTKRQFDPMFSRNNREELISWAVDNTPKSSTNTYLQKAISNELPTVESISEAICLGSIKDSWSNRNKYLKAAVEFIKFAVSLGFYSGEADRLTRRCYGRFNDE